MIEPELMISCVDNFDKKEDDNKRLTGAITPTTFNLLNTMLVKERRNWADYTDDSSQSSDELLSDNENKITKYLNLSNLNILSFEDCKIAYELLLNYLNKFKVVNDDIFFLRMCYTLIGIMPFTFKVIEYAHHVIKNIYNESLNVDELQVVINQHIKEENRSFFLKFFNFVKTRLEHIPANENKVIEFIEKISNLKKIDEESIPESGFEITKLTYRGYEVSDSRFIESSRFILLMLSIKTPPHPRYKDGSYNLLLDFEMDNGVRKAVINPNFPYSKQKKIHKNLLMKNSKNQNFALLVSYFNQLESSGFLIEFIKEAHILNEQYKNVNN